MDYASKPRNFYRDPKWARNEPSWANMAEEDIEEEDPENRRRRMNTEKARRELTKESLRRERYAANVKEKARMGLKRTEKPKKIQQPCKWVVGQFKGDECWAYEYTDPKTGKRECPHTCQRLHPGEEGWHKEWLNSPRWKPKEGGRRTRKNRR